MTTDERKPWYRQFWFWFVIAPPAASIVAGLGLVWVAMGNADDLVVDDYRKIGRTFEQQHGRDRAAAERQATVRLAIDREDGRVNAILTIIGDPPATISLSAIHPTEADRDLQVSITRGEDGVYRGRFAELPADRRYLQLEPVDRSWRLTGELAAGQSLIDL
jgi:uncharacterized protein